MKTKPNKSYFEEFAARVLVKAGELPQPFSVTWLQDKPDLQIGEIGIEVTEAIYEHDGAERAYINKMLSGTYEEAEKMQKNNTNKDRFRPLKINYAENETIIIDERARVYDEGLTMELILSCIMKKQEKWKHYGEFSDKRLYIKVEDDFLGRANHPLDATGIIKAVSGSIFKVVYLYLNHTLYVIDGKSQQPIKHRITAESECEIAGEVRNRRA